MAKVKVLTSASRASIRVKNLDRRRKVLNFFLVAVVLEHAWLFREELTKLIGAL